LITRRGVGLTTVAIAVFFLASTTRVGWVHLADAVLWGVIMLSLAVPWLSMPGLRVSRNVTAPARDGLGGPIEGGTARLSLMLRNQWWLPRFLVSLTCTESANDVETLRRSIVFWSSPRSLTEHETRVGLETRGLHSFGDITVEISGPFGLFRRRRRVAARNTVLVYPRWEHIDRLGLLDASRGDSEGGRRARTGTETAGTRPYAPGDPYRTIHWRNSARSGRFAVREFDTWHDRSVIFAIDTGYVEGDSPESTLDYAARLAASASRSVVREGGTATLLTPLHRSPDYMDWPGFMEEVAKLTPGSHGNGLEAAVERLGAGTRLVAFVPAGSSRLARILIDASNRGLSVAAVAFEGFAPGPPGASVASALEQSGVRVIRCVQGDLAGAVQAMNAGVSVSAAQAQSRRRISPKEEAA
jgi:hypothetical protein